MAKNSAWIFSDTSNTTVSVRTRIGLPVAPSACKFCKKRKIKCDGCSPCFQCIKRRILCEYENSANREEIRLPTPIESTGNNELLATELTTQRELVSYWRNVALKSRKPVFSETTSQVLSNSSIITTTLSAFQEVNQRFFPYQLQFPSESSVQDVWNSCITSAIEESISKVRPEPIALVVTTFQLSVAFTLGATWLELYDLAHHFQTLARGYLNIINTERDVTATTPAIVTDTVVGLIYLSLYYKARGEYPAFSAIVGIIARLVDCGMALDKFVTCRASGILILTAKSKGSQKYWLDFHDRNQPCTCNHFRSFAKACSSLTMPNPDLSLEGLDSIEKNLNKAERLLQNVTNPEMFKFYYVWICGLRAALYVQSKAPAAELLGRSIASAMANIDKKSLYLWLAADLSYFYYVSAKTMAPELCVKYRMLMNTIRFTELNMIESASSSSSQYSPDSNNNSPNYPYGSEFLEQ